MPKTDLKKMINQAKSIYNSAINNEELGFIDEAIVDYNNAISALENILSNINKEDTLYLEVKCLVSTSYNKLGILYRSLDMFMESEDLIKESITIIKELTKHDSKYLIILSTSLNELALTYDCQDKNGLAKDYYNEAIKILNDIIDENSNIEEFEMTITILNNMAAFYVKTEEYDMAEMAMEHIIGVVEILAKKDKAYNVKLANAYNQLAITIEYQDKIDGAIEYYKKSIELFNEITDYNSPSEQQNFFADAIYNLGTLYKKINKLIEAEGLFIKEIIIRQSIYKENESYAFSLAEAYNQLGIVIEKQGCYDEVAEKYQSAVDIMSEIIDKNSPAEWIRLYADICDKLAMLYKDMGDYAEAEELLNKEIELKYYFNDDTACFKVSIANIYNQLGEIYKSHNILAKSEENLITSFNIISEVINENSSIDDMYIYLQISNNLIDVYKDIKLYKYARNYCEKSISIINNMIQKNDSYILEMVSVFHKIGSIYSGEGDLKKAIQYVKKAIDLYKRINNEKTPFRAKFYYASILRYLGQLYMTNNMILESERIFEESLSLCRDLFCFNRELYFWDYAKALEDYSIICYYSSDDSNYKSKALIKMEETYSILKGFIDSESTLKDQNALACFIQTYASMLQDEKDYKNAYRLYEESLQIYDELKSQKDKYVINCLYTMTYLASLNILLKKEDQALETLIIVENDSNLLDEKNKIELLICVYVKMQNIYEIKKDFKKSIYYINKIKALQFIK